MTLLEAATPAYLTDTQWGAAAAWAPVVSLAAIVPRKPNPSMSLPVRVLVFA
ncbi:hypothetical protein [Actinomadura rudentiformis]|uniref:hypothetical protein n=1 Tax=Actinomadura rudentiformis TaxID=359158 RepID=UPI00178C4B5A|nr:hypothetical protein [Actinomadura rudentiformis]